MPTSEAYSKAEEQEAVNRRLRAQRNSDGQKRAMQGSSLDGAPAKYKPLKQDEEAPSSPSQPPEDASCCARVCFPILVLICAFLVATAQLQVASETRYRYDWEVKNVEESGQGREYAFNLWQNARQVSAPLPHAPDANVAGLYLYEPSDVSSIVLC